MKGSQAIPVKEEIKSRPRGEKLDIGTRQEILADNTAVNSTTAVYKSLVEEKETTAVPVYRGDPSNTVAAMPNTTMVSTITRVLEAQKVEKNKGKEKVNPPNPRMTLPSLHKTTK